MDILTKINDDISYLAGATITRRYGTEGELLCSEYIRNRLLNMGLQPVIEPFNCSRETFQIFSLYWMEFLFVILLTIFFPLAGFLYGVIVFFLYFLEISGYFSLSKFVPEYQSQNIHTVIRKQDLFDEPKYRIVFHANYDCGISHFLYSKEVMDFLPVFHHLIVICMLVVLGISLRDELSNIVPWQDNISMLCRIFVGIVLGTMSFIALIATANEEDTRGANFNASGVACLLGVAEFLAERPLEDVEIHFVFSGAYQSWMSGLRHFLKKNPFPKKETLFINVEGVGSGDLHIITRESMIFTFHVDKEILEFIERHNFSSEIGKADSLPLPTSSYMVALHGYKCFTIMGLDKDKKPIYCNQIEDTTLNIDEKKIQKTSEILSKFAMLWTEERK